MGIRHLSRSNKFSEAQLEVILVDLKNHLQNKEAHMTREHYFEMCLALGSEPIDEEIPIEPEDLPSEIQDILELYHQLEDRYSEFSGVYMGKSYLGFAHLHDIFCRDLDRIFCLRILRYIDSLRQEDVHKRHTTKKATVKP